MVVGIGVAVNGTVAVTVAVTVGVAVAVGGGAAASMRISSIAMLLCGLEQREPSSRTCTCSPRLCIARAPKLKVADRLALVTVPVMAPFAAMVKSSSTGLVSAAIPGMGA